MHPTITARVAASAPAIPPDTGASAYSIPLSKSNSAASCAWWMPIVDVSTTILTEELGAVNISRVISNVSGPAGIDKISIFDYNITSKKI